MTGRTQDKQGSLFQDGGDTKRAPLYGKRGGPKGQKECSSFEVHFSDTTQMCTWDNLVGHNLVLKDKIAQGQCLDHRGQISWGMVQREEMSLTWDGVQWGTVGRMMNWQVRRAEQNKQGGGGFHGPGIQVTPSKKNNKCYQFLFRLYITPNPNCSYSLH